MLVLQRTGNFYNGSSSAWWSIAGDGSLSPDNDTCRQVSLQRPGRRRCGSL